MTHGRFLRNLCVILVVAGCGVLGVTRWLVIPWVVDGSSMAPALENGDRVLVDLWTLRNRAPRPGEIVVFVGPDGEMLVKRVVREPSAGNDPYPPSTMAAASPLEPSFIVLGDNRSASRDSREFGRVPRDRIRGRVAWRYWPLSRGVSIE